MRAAIDAALVGAQLIHDRASQIAYTKREKPFNNLARYLANLIKDGKPLPHRLIPALFDQYRAISSFAVHADVGSFLHRVKFSAGSENSIVSIEYFQFAENPDERAVHGLTVLHSFVMVLDVFSDFLVTEQKSVPREWQSELRELGARIEREAEKLRTKLQQEAEIVS